MSFLHPRNWSRYSRRFSGNKEGLRQYKRVILLSQFTLFGTAVGLLHALEDLWDGLLFMPLMDGIMAVVILGCYLLNESGRHKTARIALLTFLNLFFFIYASLAHHGLGIYLYYFAWVGLAAVVFETNENVYRFSFIALSIILTILLLATDFDLFGRKTFEASAIQRSFIINLVSSMVVLVFFIVFMINMNEQSERKLLDLADEVKIKHDKLERANRDLDRFFYSTSHDLKVPLLDMKGAIHAALAELKDQEVMSYFMVLKERADKMDQFLQDITDYSRNTQTGIQQETLDLERLVFDVMDNFIFVKGADRISFRRDIQIPGLVEVDRIRVMIVLNNLVSNAIKYHRMDQKESWIRISATWESDCLTLQVADNGLGIDEELQPKIFNMFFRGTNQSKGSGLGLYIVKEAIEKMGGTISVQSQPGAGSVFTIGLPARLFPATAVPAQEPAAVTSSV